MLGVRVYSFPFIRVGKLSYSILILRFQAKMLEYSRVGLAFMWYVFYFKFPPLKTFTQKTLQLSSEGIIVKRGNSYEKIVASRCLSSLDSKILVTLLLLLLCGGLVGWRLTRCLKKLSTPLYGRLQ